MNNQTLWTKSEKGWHCEGALPAGTRAVRLDQLVGGIWKIGQGVFASYPAKQARELVECGIHTGRTGKTTAYRLVPATPKPLDQAAQTRLQNLRDTKKQSAWREPAKTKSEAAMRAWETRRARGKAVHHGS